MEREILITDLTAMHEDRVCIAGIDRDWNTIRPAFARSNPTRSHLQRDSQVLIRPRAVVAMQLEPLADPAAPHVEDHLWTGLHRMRIVDMLDDDRWLQALQGLVERCPRPLFGGGLKRLGKDRNRVTRPGDATYSLATVQCSGDITFRFNLKAGNQTGFRYALRFSDSRGEVYENIPVTDLALRAWADARFNQGANPQAVSDELTAELNAAHSVCLRVGLGREYKGKLWLQVNGIYSFPDWLGGRCFADFDAAPG